ncbi:transmembrane protein, putative, partial [Rhizoctonia solani AG-3 Rhs1AP]
MASRSRQPTYITHVGPDADANEGAFSSFMKNEIWAADKRAGNISLLTGVGLFLGSIILVRNFGDLLIPA